ncbi:hypothetical protein [Microbacterium sp. GXF7504]
MSGHEHHRLDAEDLTRIAAGEGEHLPPAPKGVPSPDAPPLPEPPPDAPRAD